jgi:hypothetical protein
MIQPKGENMDVMVFCCIRGPLLGHCWIQRKAVRTEKYVRLKNICCRPSSLHKSLPRCPGACSDQAALCVYHRINGFRNVKFQLYINMLIILSAMGKEQAPQSIFFFQKNVNKKIRFLASKRDWHA